MNLNTNNKTILIAPLNWGLGHATRCIPIIKALQENNYIPIIASDGIALDLLKKEFPYLQTLELPSYQIEYAKNGKNY
jgi:UDP:flavonoid glycosyltransferase YjiC (YdhE family)